MKWDVESRVREGRPIKEPQPEISAPGVSRLVNRVRRAAVPQSFYREQGGIGELGSRLVDVVESLVKITILRSLEDLSLSVLQIGVLGRSSV